MSMGDVIKSSADAWGVSFGGSLSNIVCDFSSGGATAGNLLVAVAAVTNYNSGGYDFTILASGAGLQNPSSWNKTFIFSGNYFSSVLFWKVAEGGETGVTVSTTQGGLSGAGHLFEIDSAGLALTAVNASSSDTSNGTGTATTTATGTAAGSAASGLALALFSHDAGGAALDSNASYSNGFAQIWRSGVDNNYPGLHLARKLITANSNAVTYTSDLAGASAGALLVFAQSAVGTTPVISGVTPDNLTITPPSAVQFNCTTNVPNGTARIILDSIATTDTIAATQILAGHNDTDAVAAYDTGNISVTGTTITATFASLAPGNYRYAIAQTYGGLTSEPMTGVILVRDAGYSTVVVGTPNPNAALRIETDRTPVSGDICEWGNIVGTGSVTVYDDLTYVADATVTSFSVRLGNFVDGWSAFSVQTIQVSDTVPDAFTLSDITNADPNSFNFQTVTIAGIDVGVSATVDVIGSAVTAISTDGGETWTSYDQSQKNVELGDLVRVGISASPVPLASVSGGVTINGVSDTFSVTTRLVSIPALIDASIVQATQSSVNWSITTNKASGTLYVYVSTNPRESVSTVMSLGGTVAINSTGVKTGTATALTPGSRVYAHFVHEHDSPSDVCHSEPIILVPNGSTLTQISGVTTQRRSGNSCRIALNVDQQSEVYIYVSRDYFPPSLTAHKTGAGAVFYSYSASVNGTHTVDTGSLVAGVYWVHVMATNAAGVDGFAVTAYPFTIANNSFVIRIESRNPTTGDWESIDEYQDAPIYTTNDELWDADYEAAFATFAPTPGNVYYIATNGVDSSGVPGTRTQPFATMTYAATRMVSGDVVRFLPGVYEGTQYHISHDRANIPNGSSSQFTIIRADIPFTVTLVQRSHSSMYQDTPIALNPGTHHQWVDGFIIDSRFTTEVRSGNSTSQAWLAGSHQKLTRCLFMSHNSVAYQAAITFLDDGGTGNVVEDCHAFGCYHYCVYGGIGGAGPGDQTSGWKADFGVVRRCTVNQPWHAWVENPSAPFCFYGNNDGSNAIDQSGWSAFQNCFSFHCNDAYNHVDSASGSRCAWGALLYVPKTVYELSVEGCFAINSNATYGIISLDAWGGSSVVAARIDSCGGANCRRVETAGNMWGIHYFQSAYIQLNNFVVDSPYITTLTSSSRFTAGSGNNVLRTGAALGDYLFKHNGVWLPKAIHPIGHIGVEYGQTGWNEVRTDRRLFPFPYESQIKWLWSQTLIRSAQAYPQNYPSAENTIAPDILAGNAQYPYTTVTELLFRCTGKPMPDLNEVYA